MSKLLFYFVFFITTLSIAQDFERVDKMVRTYPEFDSLKSLVIRIQNDFSAENNQIRAAFVWVTNNIVYYKPKDQVFKHREQFVYYSDFGKEYLFRKNKENRIHKTFKSKRGVCVDYSFILNKLLKEMGYSSKVITGISKTSIDDLSTTQLYKNHTWNAVYIRNNWKLMDPTWGAGFWDYDTDTFIKSFQEHYFFTPPSEFIMDHYPAKEKWQLIKNKVGLSDFMQAPIYYPDYFLNKVKLVSPTPGIQKIKANQELQFEFTNLPEGTTLKYYMNGFKEPRKMKVKRLVSNFYSTKLRLRKKLKNTAYLLLLINERPILNFKIEPSTN